jgi:two-component system LytT family sensor kinase
MLAPTRIHPRSLAIVPSAVPLPPPGEHLTHHTAWRSRAALGAWLLINLLLLAPDFRGALLRDGRPAGGGLAALLALPSSLVLAAAAWAAFRLTRRHTLARRGLARSLALHAGAAMGFALLNTVVRKAVRLLLADPGPSYGAARDRGELAAVLIIYAALAMLAHALEYGRRYRERRLAELRLQASLARAELDRAGAELRVLKLQLNPHFLFNALHAVSALVHDAPDAAERMVVRLGDLLRHARSRAGTQEVPLDEEVRTLEPFLEVEGIRMRGRLRVEWRIDPAARGAYVPHMVLQPLVENAIKHGLAGRAEGGCVGIEARRDGPWLELAVQDDGAGLAAAADRGGGGVGTANTRARLSQLYGDEHAMEMAPVAGGGTRVSLRLPWHTAPVPSRALAAPPADAAAAPGGRIGWPGLALAAALFAVLARRAYVEIHGMHVLPGRVRGAAEAVVCGGLHAGLLTLLYSAAFVLARRAPVVSRAALGRHARVALALALAMTLERNGCAVPWGTPTSVLTAPAALRGMGVEVVFWMGQFLAASLLAHALEYARRARATEAAGLRLQASVARAELRRTSAELRGLRMQVNPAFLFSALGAVASRVHAAPADAERMVVRLADLLRHAMAGAGAGAREVPLEEEMRALEPFLEVERIRRGERLRVEWEVDDDALDALVPPMLLQPLVVDALARGGDLAVRAERSGDWLEVEVRGVGAVVDDEANGGVSADDLPSAAHSVSPLGHAAADGSAAEEDGVAEARARLAQAYGGGCTVERAAMDGGGTRTRLRLPWHEEPWAAPASASTHESPAP